MKQLLFAIAFNAITLGTHAQNKLLIYAGPQMSSAVYTNQGEQELTQYKKGFHAGFGMKVPFENQLYFAPTVFYSLKGYRVDLTRPSIPPDPAATSNETRIHTAEIAALMQIDLSKKAGHLYVKFGPSFDAQISGREKYVYQDKTEIEQPMKYSYNDYGYLGANLMFQLGYESKSGWLVGATASHGLGSIYNADYGPRIVPRVASISFGRYLQR